MSDYNLQSEAVAYLDERIRKNYKGPRKNSDLEFFDVYDFAVSKDLGEPRGIITPTKADIFQLIAGIINAGLADYIELLHYFPRNNIVEHLLRSYYESYLESVLHVSMFDHINKAEQVGWYDDPKDYKGRDYSFIVWKLCSLGLLKITTTTNGQSTWSVPPCVATTIEAIYKHDFPDTLVDVRRAYAKHIVGIFDPIKTYSASIMRSKEKTIIRAFSHPYYDYMCEILRESCNLPLLEETINTILHNASTTADCNDCNGWNHVLKVVQELQK